MNYKNRLKKYLENGGREELSISRRNKDRGHSVKKVPPLTSVHSAQRDYEGVCSFKYDEL